MLQQRSLAVMKVDPQQGLQCTLHCFQNDSKSNLDCLSVPTAKDGVFRANRVYVAAKIRTCNEGKSSTSSSMHLAP